MAYVVPIRNLLIAILLPAIAYVTMMILLFHYLVRFTHYVRTDREKGKVIYMFSSWTRFANCAAFFK